MTTAPDGPKELPADASVLPRDAVQRWRLVLERGPIDGESAQRDQQAAWDGALVRSGLPVAGLDAARARPRFVLAAPLGAGIAGEAEIADLWLVERLPVWFVREALEEHAPADWRLRDLYDVWLGEPSLPGQVAASLYRATFDPSVTDPAVLAAAAVALLAAEQLPRERQKGDRLVAYDLRPFLAALEVGPPVPGSDGIVLRMTLRHDAERGVGRPDETVAALGEQAGLDLVPSSLVRAGLELAVPAPRAAAPRRTPSQRRSPGPGRGSVA